MDENKKLRKNELKEAVEIRKPIVWINNTDHKEVKRLIDDTISAFKDYAVYEYKATRVVSNKDSDLFDLELGLKGFLKDIVEAIKRKNLFIIIKNSDKELENQINIGYLREIAERVYNDREYNATVIVVSELSIDVSLNKYANLIKASYMTCEEIEEYIEEFSKYSKMTLVKKDLKELSKELKGFSMIEIDTILNKINSINNKLAYTEDIRDIINKEKKLIINKSSILEIVEFNETLEDIGGLEKLKEELMKKADIISNVESAIKHGVEIPKGVLISGVPGCGKSLTAKVISNIFKYPLVKLNLGKVFNKYVGETEKNMREALDRASAISPCILWIDEIEKGFSGIGHEGGASDITTRIYGEFLTWLQDNKEPVFVVATANDISYFGDEFLRNGRFDEIFYVDLPDKSERKKIFEIHLKKRGKLIKDIDTLVLARKTKGYCGADIEKIVKKATEENFHKNKNKNLTTSELLEIIEKVEIRKSIDSDILNKNREMLKKKNLIRAHKILLDDDTIYVEGGKCWVNNKEVEVEELEIGNKLVTNKLWNSIMPTIKYGNDSGYVIDVSLLQALEFCNKYSIKYGLKPVYKLTDDGYKVIQLDGLEVDVSSADFSKTEGFRLPIESEWVFIDNLSKQSNSLTCGNFNSKNIDTFTCLEWTHSIADSRGQINGYIPGNDNYSPKIPYKKFHFNNQYMENVGFRIVRTK